MSAKASKKSKKHKSADNEAPEQPEFLNSLLPEDRTELIKNSPWVKRQTRKRPKKPSPVSSPEPSSSQKTDTPTKAKSLSKDGFQPLDVLQMRRFLRQLETSMEKHPARASRTAKGLMLSQQEKLRTANGEFYPDSFLKQELRRYLLMACSWREISVESLVGLLAVFTTSKRAVPLYPDFPHEYKGVETGFKAYRTHFCRENKDLASKQGLSKFAKMQSESWKKLSPEERGKFDEQAELLNLEMEERLEQFFEKHPETEKYKSSFLETLSKRNRKAHPKILQEPLPLVAFDVFRRENLDKLKEKYGLEDGDEKLEKKLHKKFKRLDEDSKGDLELKADTENEKKAPIRKRKKAGEVLDEVELAPAAKPSFLSRQEYSLQMTNPKAYEALVKERQGEQPKKKKKKDKEKPLEEAGPEGEAWFLNQ